MIRSKLIALETLISRAMPPFRVKGTLMLLPPIHHVLRGVWFDRSAYDEESFSVTAFLLPLCVPTDQLYFNFGHRIRHEGGGDRWDVNAPGVVSDLIVALRAQAMPLLANGDSLEGFIEIARSGSQSGRNLEGLGYALALSGEIKQAIEVFSRLIPMLDPNVKWQRELANQVRALSTKLNKHPNEAQLELEKCEDETMRKLGLEEFRQAT